MFREVSLKLIEIHSECVQKIPRIFLNNIFAFISTLSPLKQSHQKIVHLCQHFFWAQSTFLRQILALPQMHHNRQFLQRRIKLLYNACDKNYHFGICLSEYYNSCDFHGEKNYFKIRDDENHQFGFCANENYHSRTI